MMPWIEALNMHLQIRQKRVKLSNIDYVLGKINNIERIMT